MKENGDKDERIDDRLQSFRHKILVLSGKGGVGKSTVATNISMALSEKGHTVGLLDIDIHGPSIPKMLGVEDKKPDTSADGIQPIEISKNLKVMSMAFLLQDRDTPVIWRGPMKMQAIKQLIGDVNWGELDYFIVDLPPGTGDEPLSIAQLMPNCDGAVIVTTPQDVALVSVRKSINFVKQMKMPVIGIVENMSGFRCPNCGEVYDIFKSGGGADAARDFDAPFLGRIPIDPQIVTNGDSGHPFPTGGPDSDTAESFSSITAQIVKLMEKSGNKRKGNRRTTTKGKIAGKT